VTMEKQQQITANVYAEDRFNMDRGCTPSFVTTSEGVVMIDSPMFPTDAVKWRDLIKINGEIRYIVNTDYHIDHITGNYFFPGTVIAHQGVRDMLTGPITNIVASERAEKLLGTSMGIVDYIQMRIKEKDPAGLPLARHYQVRPPTITFSEQLNLHLGKHTFELIHLPGHTPYHIGVYVPEEKVFFAGDNFTGGMQPSMAHCMPLEWIQSLKQIQKMDVEAIVPGHGRIGGKKEVREFTAFLQKCIDKVNEAIKTGMSKEEAIDKISFLALLPAVHPDPGMQRRNVARLYEMLSK
jgi:cyclase